MRKLVQACQFKSLLLPSPSQNYASNHSKSLLSLITSSSIFSHNRACSSTSDQNVGNFVLADYLVGSLKFSEDRALSFSSSFSRVRSVEKPKEVVDFFKALGFSDAQIQSITHGLPRVLFANVEKTLKPKIIFFKELGLSGPCIRSLISRSPFFLTYSVERNLKPSIRLIKRVLKIDGRNRSKEQVNDDLFRILTRCNRIVCMKSRMKENVLYLESCGVVESQLSALLVRQTRLFILPRKKLEELVSKAVAMNFTMDSRMLAHGIHGLSCMSSTTLNDRFEVFMMFGFSKDELASMFRKSPCVFRLSEAKLRSRLEFFLNDLKLKKMLLYRNPALLGLSEDRVVPRYKVLEILKSRRLLRKDPGFMRAMQVSNQQFIEQYILPFEHDVEEIPLAYEGKLLDTSEE